MNNEEKILQMLEKMNDKIDIIQNDVTNLKQNQATMQEDIDQIKEDTAITRSATNSVLEWIDEASTITQIKFPVRKKKTL